MKKLSLSKKRFYALMVDLVLALLIDMAILLSFGAVIQETSQYLTPTQKFKFLDTLSNWELSRFPVIFFLYYFSSYLLNEGATIGKSIFGLRVIMGKGRMSFFKTAVRCIFHSLLVTKAFPLLGLAFFTKDGRGLHDWVSQTNVTDIPEKKASIHQISKEEFYDPEYNHDKWAA